MSARIGKRAGTNRRRLGVTPARECALEVLRRVEEDGAYASAVLATGVESLQPNDRALCYEIVLGVLRWQLWLDRCLTHFAGRDAAKFDPEVRRALRAGLYQLRFLTRVPPSAVVNETVAHVRAAGFSSAAGFANAVLRRAAREPDFDPAENIEDNIERLSVATSHPEFLIRRWTRFFGMTEAEALAHANNRASPTVFRLNAIHPRAAIALDELRAAGVHLVASTLAPGAWRIEGALAALRKLEAEGVVYLQTEASQLVAHVLDAKEGETILDACAAPGSKTSHIASLAGDRALVIAGDIHPHRLRLLLRLANRQNLRSIRTIALNAAGALPFRDESFDRVLVDVPCTGTGTLRHNPEIRWRIAAADIGALVEIQCGILREAARTVRRSGRLVYSTCSVEPDENEEVVAEFLQSGTGWHVVADAVSDALRTETGAARTFPHRHDTDGFFMQVFEKQ